MSAHDPKDPALIEKMSHDKALAKAANNVFVQSCAYRYSYNFRWLGRPIIQYPQDMIAIQEIIFDDKPDVIIETGIAHGGSLIFSASILELMGSRGRVVGIDIDIRPHNRNAIEQHPMAKRISLIEGSSVAQETVAAAAAHIGDGDRVMVILDSNHTEAHVLEELRLYSPLVTKGCHLVVMDTVVEDMPKDLFPDRPWGPGDNPKTAVRKFLKEASHFEVDQEYDRKLLLSVCPEGYLRRTS